MYWIVIRRTSAWAGGVVKAFIYPAPPVDAPPGADSALSSFTRPQLEALVVAAKKALAEWPED